MGGGIEDIHRYKKDFTTITYHSGGKYLVESTGIIPLRKRPMVVYERATLADKRSNIMTYDISDENYKIIGQGEFRTARGALSAIKKAQLNKILNG